MLQKRKTNFSIPVVIKLASTLRFLAGGVYLDLSFGYDLDENNIHKMMFQVIKAMDDCDDPFLNNIIFPTDKDGLAKLEAGFNRLSPGRFRGTVAAGDGVVFHDLKEVS
jgi:hypothetical protein